MLNLEQIQNYFPPQIRELRFDEDFMQTDLNIERLNEFAERFQSKTVRNRVGLLLKIYGLC